MQLVASIYIKVTLAPITNCSYLENELYFFNLSSEEPSRDFKHSYISGRNLKYDIPEPVLGEWREEAYLS